MALDRSVIGRDLPGESVLITRSRLRDFATANLTPWAPETLS